MVVLKVNTSGRMCARMLKVQELDENRASLNNGFKLSLRTERMNKKTARKTLATSQTCPVHKKSFKFLMQIFPYPKVLMKLSKAALESSMLLTKLILRTKNLKKSRPKELST
ncbi:hypothetical protein ACSBR2_016870 [Camellia fascicularis]